MKTQKPGTVAPNRIPIVSKSGDVVGNVGPRATTATVARFLGHHNARLTQHRGRTSWVEQGTNSRPRPMQRPESANHKAARGSVRAPGTEVASRSK